MNTVFSAYLKSSFLVWLHFLANSFGWVLVVDVGGPPIHPCPKWRPYFCIQKRATNHSWLPSGPAIRLLHEKVDGTPKLPKGVPALVPLWPLLGNVVVHHTKKNQQKELIRADECLIKQSFIQ